MKTKAIRECIDYLGPDSGCVAAKNDVAELKSLELALAEAEKREAVLSGSIEAALRIKQLWRYPDDVMPQHEGEASAITEMETSFDAALSTTQTDKVLVSVGRLEKLEVMLKKTEWTVVFNSGSQWTSCPVCEGINGKHEAGCRLKEILIWLSAKLKEVGDGS